MLQESGIAGSSKLKCATPRHGHAAGDGNSQHSTSSGIASGESENTSNMLVNGMAAARVTTSSTRHSRRSRSNSSGKRRKRLPLLQLLIMPYILLKSAMRGALIGE